jgi:pantothenate kinase-related protein Tda10
MIQNNSSFANSSEAASKIAAEITKRHTDKTKNFLVAIDGRSGTGKSTLAKLVAEKVNGVMVISDDFYSGGQDERWQWHEIWDEAEDYYFTKLCLPSSFDLVIRL